ncbi:WD40 repeat domain-containing protein [Vibrio sp. WXL210]|uniref:WD40 repeat domain-containing protein n=1 Tax=Vibrio sp. WXL210 TaxID=3450709 RepID=UPI003EC7458A
MSVTRFLAKNIAWISLLALNGCFFGPTQTAFWELEPQGASSFALSRDARFALTYSPDNQLVIWDLKQNSKLADLGHLDTSSSRVSRMRISDSGRFAVTAGQTNFAVWDLGWAKSQGLWSISDGLIRDADIANHGQQVLLGLTNGKAIHVDLVSGRRIEFLAHNEKVNSVAIAANGRYALTGGNDYHAYLWDTETGQILRTFTHQNRVNRVALQRDGRLAFTSDGGNMAVIWDLTTGEQVSELKSLSRQLIFSSARFSDDGHWLVTGTPSGRITVWDTHSGKKVQQMQAQVQKDTRPARAVVYDAAFTDHQQIVAATSAGIAQAWEFRP